MKKRRRKKPTSDNFPLSEVSRIRAINCTEVDILPAGQMQMPSSVRNFVGASLAPNTLKAYRSDVAHFKRWGGCFPASPLSVAEYLAEHASTHAISTLQRRLVAIRVLHQSLGLRDPVQSSLVRSTFRGIRRTKSRSQRQVLPLLQVDLQQVIDAAGTSLHDIRNAALLLVGLAGALRRSELVGIDVEHLDFRKEGVRICIPRSKTDPYGVGRTISIRTAETQVCAARALRLWLEQSAIQKGPVFRSIRSIDKLGKRLSGEAVSKIVKWAAHALGRPGSDYSSHSLRAGYVTDAAIRGDPAWKIQLQTGHSSFQMLARYIRVNNSLYDDFFKRR